MITFPIIKNKIYWRIVWTKYCA